MCRSASRLAINCDVNCSFHKAQTSLSRLLRQTLRFPPYLKGTNPVLEGCGLSEKSPVLNTSGAYMVIELGLALGALILLNIPTSLMQREDETD